MVDPPHVVKSGSHLHPPRDTSRSSMVGFYDSTNARHHFLDREGERGGAEWMKGTRDVAHSFEVLSGRAGPATFSTKITAALF